MTVSDSNQEIRAQALQAAAKESGDFLTNLIVAEEFYVPWITSGTYPESLLPKLDEHRQMLSRKWNVPLGRPIRMPEDPDLEVMAVDPPLTSGKKTSSKEKKTSSNKESETSPGKVFETVTRHVEPAPGDLFETPGD